MSANLVHSVMVWDSCTSLCMRQHTGDFRSINFDDFVMFSLHMTLENDMVCDCVLTVLARKWRLLFQRGGQFEKISCASLIGWGLLCVLNVFNTELWVPLFPEQSVESLLVLLELSEKKAGLEAFISRKLLRRRVKGHHLIQQTRAVLPKVADIRDAKICRCQIEGVN